MFRKNLRNENGFTMIEMMVVLIIIAVLIGGGIKFYLGYIENSKVTKAKSNMTVMQGAMDSYYAENNAYPAVADLPKAGITTSNDPWNKQYVWALTSDTYVLRTGQGDINTTNYYVVGKGSYGKSDPPSLSSDIIPLATH